MIASNGSIQWPLPPVANSKRSMLWLWSSCKRSDKKRTPEAVQLKTSPFRILLNAKCSRSTGPLWVSEHPPKVSGRQPAQLLHFTLILLNVCEWQNWKMMRNVSHTSVYMYMCKSIYHLNPFHPLRLKQRDKYLQISWYATRFVYFISCSYCKIMLYAVWFPCLF